MIKKTTYLLSFLAFSHVIGAVQNSPSLHIFQKSLSFEDIIYIPSQNTSPGITPEIAAETPTESFKDKLYLPPNNIIISISYIRENEHNLELMKNICESKYAIEMLAKLGVEIIQNQLWFVCEDSRPADCPPNDDSWPFVILK